jgi:rhodanese-related sulfurtransferase
VGGQPTRRPRSAARADRGRTLEQLLDAARSRITRLEPAEAFAALEEGALLIDIRSESDRIVLICDHGCSSVLAAAALVELGFAKTGDVIGGFGAWRDAGLPTAAAPTYQRRPGEIAGMRAPDRGSVTR